MRELTECIKVSVKLPVAKSTGILQEHFQWAYENVRTGNATCFKIQHQNVLAQCWCKAP